jgi:PrtD family type I secretion system ABC transporter
VKDSRQARRNDLREALAASASAFGSVGIFSCCINLLMLVVPLYMLQVYDRVLMSRSEDTLLMLTILVLGLLLANATLELVRARVMVRISSSLDDRLNGILFSAMHRARLRGGGDQGAQPLRDLDALRTFLTGSGLIAFFDAPWMPVFIAVVFMFHPLLGIIALCGAAVLFVMAVLNEVATRSTLRDATRESLQAQGYAAAALRNGEVIEAMGMLPALRRRWLALHERGIAFQAVASDRAGALTAVVKFLRPLLQVAMLGVGAVLAIEGEITPGVMVAGSIIMGRALAPVEAAIGGWRGFVAARGAYGRLKETLAGQDDRSTRMSLPRPAGQLTVEGLHTAPPGVRKPIIHNVSFALQAGEVLGIIGPSAAGKSTLARAVIGVWPALSGHVRLDGADVSDWDHEELGPHIGYLPQDVELFDGTIAENIARLQEPDSAKVMAAARQAGLHEIILHLPDGYDTRIGDGGSALSGGQRQRVALARALYGEPALVVLDEPNANLDNDGEEALRRALANLKAGGTTVVIVAHRPSILSVADKLLVLRSGRVEAFGPRAEIIAKMTRAVSADGETTRIAAAAVQAQ